MLRVSQDDEPSFEALLARNRRMVLRHLYRLVHNQAIAEELAQEVFLRVYRARRSYRPGARFATWLFRITTNVALNWRRDSRHESLQLRLDDELENGRKFEIADRAPNVGQRLAEEQRAAQIRAVVESLPPKQLAAVLLHKYEGLDYAQIAKVLDCSIPALKSLLFRAYETLRRRLAHFAPRAF